jgi:hypothetical protein
VSRLTKINEYPLQASFAEIMEKIKGIIESLTQQREIIQANRDKCFQFAIELQKNMKFKLDIIRNLEDEIDLQKSLVSCIAESDLTGIPFVVPEIFSLHDSAIATLNSMEKLQKENNAKLISEIQTRSYQFKNGLLDYVEYLETVLPSKGEAGLKSLDKIVEARNKLTQISAYIIKEKK